MGRRDGRIRKTRAIGCAIPPGWLVALGLVVGSIVGSSGATAQDREGFRNLQVLPEDIDRSELIDIMLDNLSGLGLPRRANEGCLFCHTGSMDVPASQWDWASDGNPMKDRARVMMAMVRDINANHLDGLDRTYDDDIGCATCHAGRTNPMPLPAVLARSYEAGGVEGVIERYRDLRRRYFAADAYDFRTGTLAEVARAVAASGATDDAARIHELNIEYSDDPEADRGLIRLRMLEALARGDIEAMIAEYHGLRTDHPTEAYSPALIDGLAWSLFRSDREEAGFALFRLNHEEHPRSYTTTESLAWGNAAMGDQARAIELAEAWLAEHPDHELGLRLLADLRGEGED